MNYNQDDVFNKLYADEVFNKNIEYLTFNQFLSSHKQDGHIPIDFTSIKKCVWIASILALSPNESHRRKVQLFAMLSFLIYSKNTEIEKATLLLLSRLGNLTATRHLPNFNNLTSQNLNVEEEDTFDSILNLELAIQLNDKIIFVENGTQIIATRFQKELWSKLNDKTNIAISAPTSAGKSFIIKQFINRLQIDAIGATFIYIVPSRALINQVSEELREEFNEKIEIHTSFLETLEIEKEKNSLYVLTSERCLRFIQHAYENRVDVKVIFIDEIQNIEDDSGRGTILEFVLKELSTLFPEAQIIIAGPNITNTDDLFRKLFNKNSTTIRTDLSPVFQIKTIVKPLDEESIQIAIKPLENKTIIHNINVGFDLQKAFKSGIGIALAKIIDYFTPGQSSIIFAPRSDYAELWALKYLQENVDYLPEINERTKELIEYLEEEVHTDYFLIDCLKKGVAFHHSKLPDIVRKEIEDGFLAGRIHKLFCTSTLIEGVNLPANNLFIVSPKILNQELTAFNFGNLIGRAGRLKDSLYGTIYCIEKNLNDEWAGEYYDKSYGKDVIPSTDASIQNDAHFIDQILIPPNEIEHKRDENTVTLIRQKFLQSPQELERYLFDKQIPEESIKSILINTEKSLAETLIKYEVTRKNPSIDPIKQERLRKAILESGISYWSINVNRNFEARVKKEDVSGNYQDWSFFWQFSDLITRLDSIFDIWKEVNIDANIDLSIKQMAIYGVRWTTGQSYKKLIKEDLNFMSRHSNLSKRIDPKDKAQVNKRINNVIKINSIVVSHILVKYLKVLNDILSSIMNEEEKEKYKFTLALPTMLELGTRSPQVHQLISRGVARSIAMKVFELFQKNSDYENLDVFVWLKEQSNINLKPIYKRYLTKLKLIK